MSEFDRFDSLADYPRLATFVAVSLWAMWGFCMVGAITYFAGWTP